MIETLTLSTRLIGFAILLQTLELWVIRPWSWSIVKSEMPKFLKPYRMWLSVRLCAAITALVLATPLTLPILLLSSWAISARWRGTFNGGSDTLSMHILFGLCLGQFLRPDVGLIYIAIYLTLSYFVAGLAKLFQSEWRDGSALAIFLNRTSRQLHLSWIIIMSELSFPIGLILSPKICLLVAFIFHLGVFYKFSLNRFVWVWLAAFPAAHWTSNYL